MQKVEMYGEFKALLVLWALVLLLMVFSSGCAAPLLLGVKTYQSGDTRIDFITGADFNIGANGIDSDDDRRGIAPEGGYLNGGQNYGRK